MYVQHVCFVYFQQKYISVFIYPAMLSPQYIITLIIFVHIIT